MRISDWSSDVCSSDLLAFGIRAGFGLFVQPVSADFGWGREVFALSIAIQNLVWGVAQPIAGMVADRYGSGRVLALGALLYALGVILMSVASPPAEAHLQAGGRVGAGLAGTSFVPVF